MAPSKNVSLNGLNLTPDHETYGNRPVPRRALLQHRHAFKAEFTVRRTGHLPQAMLCYLERAITSPTPASRSSQPRAPSGVELLSVYWNNHIGDPSARQTPRRCLRSCDGGRSVGMEVKADEARSRRMKVTPSPLVTALNLTRLLVGGALIAVIVAARPRL